MNIVIASSILGVVALIFAILIAIFSKKLAVKEDERLPKIVELLSGANCGGCGYAGCEAFARAVLAGDAKSTECPSTSNENKIKIGDIIGSSTILGEEKIMVVSCNGGTNCQDKYSYQGYGDCSSIELLAGGTKACSTGCIGMGKCVDGCNYGALKINSNNVAEVDYQKCINCGICITHCPKKLMRRIPKSAIVYLACSNHDKGKEVKNLCSKGCIGCGICVKNCATHAMSMDNNLPVIDYTLCNGCKVCITKCPSKCLIEINKDI